MGRKPTDTVQLKLRFSEALRRRLEREAKRSEHSLNAEIISRLDQSFRKAEEADLTSDTFRAAFGGPTGDLLRAFATAIWLIERRTGKKWHKDSMTHIRASLAIGHIMDNFRLPMNAARAVQDIELARSIDAGRTSPDDTQLSAMVTALQTLHAMGMGPSKEEINAEAAKRHVKGIGTESTGGGQ